MAVVGAFGKEVVGLDRERYTDGAAGVAGLHDLLCLSEASGADNNGKTTSLAGRLDSGPYRSSVLLAMSRSYAAGSESYPFSIAYGRRSLHRSHQHTKVTPLRSLCTHTPHSV